MVDAGPTMGLTSESDNCWVLKKKIDMTTPITAVQTFTNPRKSVWLLDNLKEKKIFKWWTPSKSKFNKSDVNNDIQGIELEGHVLHERMKSTGVCTSAVTWHPGGRRKVCRSTTPRGVLDGEEYLGISKDSSQKQRQVYTVHQSLMCQLARKGYKEDDRRR